MTKKSDHCHTFLSVVGWLKSQIIVIINYKFILNALILK